ncbi:unnamed protein product [Parnassius apollo]|uniref:(apollo) hypothetical protein n=1 Tax=Parnassius apollo TaxID=110799 RepID=A0A8S3WMK0_PARAO|nr:unnamed protein product [Parnassius apollo]
MQQGNANEVRIQVEEAYEYSKKLQDPEQVQPFLSKCAEMASDAVTTDERKAIEQRERQIVRIMDESQRVETQVLFKRMSTVPKGRRFSVLPQKQEGVDLKSERRRRRQRGLSVIPGPEKTLAPTPKSNTPGFQIFDV